MPSHELSTEELRQKLFERKERFFIIDTLPRGSYVNRHLPGAMSLPLEEVSDRANALLPDKDAEIVAYCSSPH